LFCKVFYMVASVCFGIHCMLCAAMILVGSSFEALKVTCQSLFRVRSGAIRVYFASLSIGHERTLYFFSKRADAWLPQI
jgi:hypothetical protein